MLGVIADYCGGKHFEYKAYALEQLPFFKRNCIYSKLGNNDTSSRFRYNRCIDTVSLSNRIS